MNCDTIIIFTTQFASIFTVTDYLENGWKMDCNDQQFEKENNST